MFRHTAGGVALAGCWLFGSVLGVASAGLRTSEGRDIVVRAAVEAANDALNGSLTIGEVSGSFVDGLDARDIQIRDNDGVLLAEIPRLQLRYGLRDLLGGRFVLGRLVVLAPRFNLVQLPGRRLNLEEVLRLGHDATERGRGPPKLIAFRDAEIVDGSIVLKTPHNPSDSAREIEETPEGPLRVRRVSGLNAFLEYLRISSPFPNQTGVRLEIARLQASVSDPSLELKQLRGNIDVHGDSLMLEIEEGALPGTRTGLDGVLVLASGGPKFQLEAQVRELDTDELRPIIPELPPGMTGGGDVSMQTFGRDGIAVRARPIALEGIGGGGTASGQLGVRLGPGSMWAFNDTRLDLENFDLEYIRDFVDTLPIAGRATGRFEADGPKDSLDIGIIVTFRDSLVDGWPETRLDGGGTVSIGGPHEAVFTDFRFLEADVDLNSARRLLPVIDLLGRIRASGRLSGPWKQLAFQGQLQHTAVGHRPTVGRGTFRIDARRDPFGVWADLDFTSLNLSGFQPTYADLPFGGQYTGIASVRGYLDSLAVRADLSHASGRVVGEANLALLSERQSIRDVDADVFGLNLQAFREDLPQTNLAGHVGGTVVFERGRRARATASVVLGASTVEGIAVDTASGAVALADDILAFDSVTVFGPSLRAFGDGSISLSTSRTAMASVTLDVASMSALEPYLESLLGPLEATDDGDIAEVTGTLHVTLSARGTVDALELESEVSARDVRRGEIYISSAEGTASWGIGTDAIDVRADIDSVHAYEFGFAGVRVELVGALDSLWWHTRLGFGVDGYGSIIGWGQVVSREDRRTVPIDSMRVLLARRPWSVEAPVSVVLSDSGVDFTNFSMRAGRGSRLSLNGRFPLRGPGLLFVDLDALPVEDLAMLLQNEYLDVSGEFDAELDLSGLARAPAIRAAVEVRDAVFGDVRAPFLQGTFYYENQLLSGEVGAWRRGSRVLSLNLRLPVDLAIRGATRRQLEGPILVRTVADSVDLQLFDFVIPTIRWETGGALQADFGIRGTWANPELSGEIEMLNGQTTLPGLGVTWTDLNGAVTLAGDSIHIQHFSGRSEGGQARVTGSIQLEELAKPILDVQIDADEFHAVEAREFLSLTTTADLRLRGPLLGATLTGRGTVTEGVLFFADLISKDVLDLEDTLYIRENLIDTLELRRQRLGEEFENRFLDSLRIDSLRLVAGGDVWLRSTEANIELDGELTVSKERDEYRLNGTLQSPRGTYRLSLGRSVGSIITREFRVTRGELTYFGTPDLNAAVDIDASHLVRTVRGENITVFVHIGGTLYDPEPRFSSDIVPPISETEVLSYLVFGAPSAQAAFATQGAAEEIVPGVFLGALSGQLEYSLIENLGVPLDYIQISPQYAGATFSGTEIAFGKRIGENWFLTVSPRLCPEAELIRNVPGASIEYRFSREWLLSLSGDPVLSCTLGTSTTSIDKYQVGFDIFWEKRY